MKTYAGYELVKHGNPGKAICVTDNGGSGRATAQTITHIGSFSGSRAFIAVADLNSGERVILTNPV